MIPAANLLAFSLTAPLSFGATVVLMDAWDAEEALSLFDVRICRECQCTDDVACMSGCWWVEEDLCSSCADDLAAEGSSLEGGRR